MHLREVGSICPDSMAQQIYNQGRGRALTVLNVAGKQAKAKEETAMIVRRRHMVLHTFLTVSFSNERIFQWRSLLAACIGHRLRVGTTIVQGYDLDAGTCSAVRTRHRNLGFTTIRVFVIGIPQLDHDDPHVVLKTCIIQETPANPNWDCEGLKPKLPSSGMVYQITALARAQACLKGWESNPIRTREEHNNLLFTSWSG
ncbi:hypothetical protein M378DRAFT_1040976 [Amanita muscaria Koide BX008]|uniref:Uncharacterized protein n=1 Tax=Amanita muscaria (strain Koide BX008) TaxID=946122 RepID=A0A0C2W3P3_AMAMK|nr:hypothetical protein M378DRAFT_1040976 [Amanita muscaria Koide BX008]